MSEYSVGDYGRMIGDAVRATAYAEALRRACRPGALVADIGTGTGFLAMLACQYGARHVFAVEPGDVIAVAREVAAANGMADRIEFIQSDASRIELPERVDVLVSDLRGVLPLDGRHLAIVADASERLLAPGGSIIPQLDSLWAAPVESADTYDLHVGPSGDRSFGLNFDPARRLAANTIGRMRISPGQLLAPPVRWSTINYRSLASPNASAEIEWRLGRAGTAHGLAVWFDTVLYEDVGFSNAPAAPKAIYGQAFLPLCKPLPLAEASRLQVAIRADLIGDDYVWRWRTRVDSGVTSGPSEFDQSTMLSLPLSRDALRRSAADHVPELNQEGRIELFVLRLLDERVTLGEAAKRLANAFPHRFPSETAALTRIGSVSTKYSR